MVLVEASIMMKLLPHCVAERFWWAEPTQAAYTGLVDEKGAFPGPSLQEVYLSLQHNLAHPDWYCSSQEEGTALFFVFSRANLSSDEEQGRQTFLKEVETNKKLGTSDRSITELPAKWRVRSPWACDSKKWSKNKIRKWFWNDRVRAGSVVEIIR